MIPCPPLLRQVPFVNSYTILTIVNIVVYLTPSAGVGVAVGASVPAGIGVRVG